MPLALAHGPCTFLCHAVSLSCSLNLMGSHPALYLSFQLCNDALCILCLSAVKVSLCLTTDSADPLLVFITS